MSRTDRAALAAPATQGVPGFVRLRSGRHLVQVASVLGGLLLWEVAADGYSRFILPPPSAVALRLLDPAFDAALLGALASSLTHMLLGFALAFGTAVPLGMLMGRLPRVNAMADPVVSALYAIPSVAFVPFFVIWFGLFFESRVALVFVMAFPDILVVAVNGARDIRRNLLDVGRSFGASKAQVARLILFPAMMPFVLTALRVGLARAINGMITAELFFAAVNLGALMKSSAQGFDTAGVMAVVVLVCVVGLLAQSFVRLIEGRFLRWHLRA